MFLTGSLRIVSKRCNFSYASRMNAKYKIDGADGIRALACLLVLFHHLSQRLNPESAPEWLKKVHYIGMRGEVGVSLFFVLSGALLSYPFWQAHLRSQNLPKLSNYVKMRSARIVPATWFNLVFCTLIATFVYHNHVDLKRVFSGLFFINSYNYHYFFPAELNGPLWSIGLEVSCYVLLPIVIFLLIKLIKKPSILIAGLMSIIFMLQLLNPKVIEFFMTDSDLKGWQYGLIGGAKEWLPYWNINTFFCQFLLGSLAALVLTVIQINKYSKNVIADLLAILAFSAASVLILTRLNPGAPDSFTNQPYMAPFYALLMACGLVCVASGRYLYKILDASIMRFIATISFGIYLWHHFIITVI